MKCPKCGFEGRGDSCARCGVVFAKLAGPPRQRRPPRPPLAPPARPAGGKSTSLVNVLVLSVLLIIGGAVAVQVFLRPSSSPDSSAHANEPALGKDGLGGPAADPMAATTPSGNANEASDGPAPRSDNVLILPGLGDGSSPKPVAAPPEITIELPALRMTSITPELVERAAALAREHPGEASLREYAALAHLTLASRRFSEQRYREAVTAASSAADWGAPPQQVAFLKALSYLKLRDLAGALEWAQAALAFGPNAEMYDVLGNVYYLREELDRAIEAWEHALELRDDPRFRLALDKARREAKLASGFDRQRLSHFIVRYEGGTMEDTGRLVLSSLERGYARLKSQLGFEPREPVVVILYTRRDYAEMGGPRWSAGLFDGKVKVPVRGLVSLDGHVESTLLHELTHAFIYARAGTNSPRWLQEGMAEYCEGTRTTEFGKKLAEKIDRDGDFSYCLAGQRCEAGYFYPGAASLVEYIIQNRGMGGIRDILGLLGEGRHIDEALREVTSRDERGLIRDWEHFIRRRYL